MTLAAARTFVEMNIEAGVICPCCDEHIKKYKRKLNSGMAAALVWLVGAYRRQGGGWVAVREIAPRHVLKSGEIGKLQHWGLIIPKPNDDPKKRTSGIWGPAPNGVLFADNKIRVPAYVYLISNVVQGWSEETTDVIEALGEDFDYAELMGDA